MLVCGGWHGSVVLGGGCSRVEQGRQNHDYHISTQ
jgi:hypothetical protein